MNRSDVHIENRGGEQMLRLSGTLDRSRAAKLWPHLDQAVSKIAGGRLVVDLEEVCRIDSGGVALLRLLERDCRKRGIECTHLNSPPQVADYLEYTKERSSGQETAEEEKRPDFIRRAGHWGLGKLQGCREICEYAGRILLTTVSVLRHPKQLRIREILYQIQTAGADALPFVIWLSGLMGFIMAIQATTTLTKFGAAIRIADVVTLGTMKEMGPLLTAIILVGRSGASYSATIGTMKVKEELNALQVMGIDPMHFLVLPRVLALLIVGPLLTLIADGAGILGGLIVGVWVMDLSAANFLTEVGKTMTSVLIWEGMIKGFVFALVIGMNGCFHGLAAGSAAEEVGIRTTVSVVSGIFLVVIADALLSGIFHVYAF